LHLKHQKEEIAKEIKDLTEETVEIKRVLELYRQEADFIQLNQDLSTIIEGADFNYLINVMRRKNGDRILVFNGVDGEWMAEISDIQKKILILKIIKKIKDQEIVKNITLAFAPVKNVRIDFIAAKATEMGVKSFLPIITKHTIINRINIERFQANIKEAVEQCERNDIPQILPFQKLNKFLSDKKISEKILILCDESEKAVPARMLLPKIFAGKKNDEEIVILIGPEGGFAKEEFGRMSELTNCHSLSLGRRILRSDTAIIAALTLVQEFL
jgi:16S rRNA (uracil1498-N3)-methyltransferase